VPVIPDLPWRAAGIGAGPGVVLVTRLQLRRFRDVPAFLRTSLAIRRQVTRSAGARSLQLRAQPLARTFTTVSWWDDDATVRAFARAEPHRGAMHAWRVRLEDFANVTLPGTEGVAPTVADAAPRALAAAPSDASRERDDAGSPR
jgi:hypothetical protein